MLEQVLSANSEGRYNLGARQGAQFQALVETRDEQQQNW